MRYVLSAICAALLLCACTTTGVEREAERQTTQPDTIQAAILYGEQLNTIYTNRGSRLRSNRTWMSLGILAANTYVMAASGLEAHPDSIFAGALVGNTIQGLDPILNAGGPAAWSAAHARNVCVVAVAGGLNTGAMLADEALLMANRNDPAHSTAITPVLARYSAYPARLTGVMREIYGRYLHQSTPELPEVNALARGVIDRRTQEAVEPEATDPAETADVQGMTASTYTLRRIYLGGRFEDLLRAQAPAIVDTEILAAAGRMTASLDYADVELPKCRPEPLTGGGGDDDGGDGDDGEGGDGGDGGDEG